MSRWLFLALVLLLSVPQQVGAYSYGDPSKEVIAEAFNEMVVKVNAADWAGTAEIYKVHRPEIESHFGASVAATLDADIEAKDQDRFVSNYKALLVLNLERRFTYANDAVNDYSQAKLLLAKAKGTYDALQPYVKNDALHKQIVAAFDEALTALGNPGLFGVGEKPIDPDTFKTKTSFILGKMKPLFPMKKAEPQPEPAPTEPKETTAEPQPKPAEPAKAEPKPEEKPTEATNSVKEATAEVQPVSETPEATEAEALPAEEAPAEPVQQETAEATTPVVEEVTAGETDGAAETGTAVAAPEPAAHAPMQRQDRTNPIISLLVIGSVAIVAAGGLVYAKKRKLF
jgi:hypothetical protein